MFDQYHQASRSATIQSCDNFGKVFHSSLKGPEFRLGAVGDDRRLQGQLDDLNFVCMISCFGWGCLNDGYDYICRF